MDFLGQDFDDTGSVSSDATDFSVSLLNGLDFDDLATTRKIDTFSQFGPSQPSFKTPVQSDNGDDAYMDEIFSQARELTQVLKWKNSLTPNTFLRKVNECPPDDDVSYVPDTPDSDFLEGALSEAIILTPVKETSTISTAKPEMILMSMPNQAFSPPSFESNTQEMHIADDDGLHTPFTPLGETTLDEKQSNSPQNNSRTPLKIQEQKLENPKDLPPSEKNLKSQKSSDDRLKGYQTPIRMYLTVSPKTPPVGIVAPTQRSPSLTIRRSRPVGHKKLKHTPQKPTAATSVSPKLFKSDKSANTSKTIKTLLFQRSVPLKLRTQREPKREANNSIVHKSVNTCGGGVDGCASKYRALMHNYFQLEKKFKKEKKKRKLTAQKLVLQNFKGRKGNGPVTSDDQMTLLSKTMSSMFQTVTTIYPKTPKVIEKVSRITEMEKERIREEVRTTKRDCDCLCFCGDQDKLKAASPFDFNSVLPSVAQKSMLMFSQFDKTV